MAGILLTQEEYDFIIGQEKDLLERAKTASPRASTHLRAVAKLHSDFLAKEEGKRASSEKKTNARQERENLKLQRQQERLAALQKRMQEQQSQQPARGARPTASAGQKSA